MKHGRILSVDLVYAEQENPLPPNADAVGIDMGVNERMTLSDGSTVEKRIVDRNGNADCSASSVGARRAVIADARRWWPLHAQSVATLFRNRNACHRLTTELVRRFGHIAVEGLQIRNMTAAGGSSKKG